MVVMLLVFVMLAGRMALGFRGWLCYVHALGGDPGVEIENIRRWLGFLLAESNLSL